MTTEQAAQKSEEAYIKAKKRAEKNGYTGVEKWSFIAGYLQNSLKTAYEDAQ